MHMFPQRRYNSTLNIYIKAESGLNNLKCMLLLLLTEAILLKCLKHCYYKIVWKFI